MAGAPRQFDEDLVLTEAMRLFWQRGYEATSIGELTDAAGINRSSMYNAFGHKDELYYAALQHYSDQRLECLKRFLTQPGAALKRLLAGLSALGEHSGEHRALGCLCCNAAVELGSRDAAVARITNQFFEQMLSTLERFLQQAVDAGELDRTTQVAPLAKAVLVMLGGIGVLQRSGGALSAKQDLSRMFMAVLESPVWRKAKR